MNDLDKVIEYWNPDLHPVHCSNCRQAKVSGSRDEPMVRCAAGHVDIRGVTTLEFVDVGRLSRTYRPLGFHNAKTCPEFERSG